MTHAVLMALVPWIAMLLASIAALVVLARISRAKWDLRRLVRLHTDQQGSVQSLSFVLTLPLFIWVVMFIVQVSQLMVGQVVVHYAAYAAARAAAVWIAADLSQQDAEEEPNRVGGYLLETTTSDPTTGAVGSIYLLGDSGLKYQKIRHAAVMACMGISPSRALGASYVTETSAVADSLTDAYNALTQSSNGYTSRRIQNKLAYADANTAVEVRFFHSDNEPPLNPLGSDFYSAELGTYFRYNEVGWRDSITVNVKHKLALLPGPGRLLATTQYGAGPASGVSGESSTSVYADTYCYLLTASATIGNEGERSVISYAY